MRASDSPFVLLAAAVVVLASLSPVVAASLGDPLSSLPAQSTPIASFAKPANVGNLTGADGDVSSPYWYATTDLGFLLTYNGADPTPVSIVDTGIPGATGVACLGGNRLAICAGKKIYEGTLNNGTWTADNVIIVMNLNGDLTDVDYALGCYFVATQNDGVRRVDGNGSSTLMVNGVAQSVDAITFEPDSFDNPMMQIASGNNGFQNMTFSGNLFGTAKLMNLNPSYTIQGLAYFDGGFAVVQAPGVGIHSPLAGVQPYMASFPEPAVPGDIDHDGEVNLADLKLLVAAWNSTPTSGNWNADADIDSSQSVNLADLKILVANWNSSVN